MKTKGIHKTTMVVTDDPVLERAARRIASDLGDALQIISNSNEATDCVFDTSRYETFAIVDADGHRRVGKAIAVASFDVAAPPHPCTGSQTCLPGQTEESRLPDPRHLWE